MRVAGAAPGSRAGSRPPRFCDRASPPRRRAAAGARLEVHVRAVALAEDEREGLCQEERGQRGRQTGHRHIGLPAQDGQDVRRGQRRARDGRVQPCAPGRVTRSATGWYPAALLLR